MSITVVPFTPDDGTAVGHAYDIVRAAAQVDLPDFPVLTPAAFEGSLRHRWPGRDFEWALALLDGVPAGYLELGMPQRDNVGNVNVWLHVLPALRRRGIGAALHAHAVTRARALGRQRLLGITAAQSPAGDVPGPIFAAGTGAHAALGDARGRLDVAALDHGELDRLLEDAYGRADGYRLVQWSGRAPDDVVADVAYLESRLNTDAPIGDIAWEAEAVDAEQIRAIEAAFEARLRRTHHSGVVHTATGRLVGWTCLALTGGQDRHAWQDTTLVDPEHRGRRLGLLIKIENLRYVLRHEPGLRFVDTFNAAANDHMIRINEAIGFRRADMWTQWQLTL
jgi:GNAT superfamily N-acetyltransferase